MAGGTQTIVTNRRARFDFELGDRFEAGSQAVTATDANYTVAYVATTSSDSVLAALNLSGA
ncbi:MAG: hypothetical protein AAF317_04390 [Pseudomonadota bacterium]